MKRKYGFVAFLLAGILLAGMALTGLYVREDERFHLRSAEDNKLTIVTSFYPMYILTLNIIGDSEHVTLTNLSEPKTGCLHDYQLTPEDMKLLSTADVFIVNGGGIESFLSEVAESYPDLLIINACENLELLNAHAWMSVSEYMVQVQTVAEQLIDADVAHAEVYSENAKRYLDQLVALKSEVKELKELTEGSNIISFHEAYEYVAEDLGINICGTLDLDEERQVSAGEIADIITVIRENDIKVVLAEELYGKEIGNTIETETGTQVYYINTLVRGEYQADSYLTGMQENIHILKEAFAQ